jgi:TetR/AcrR family transcriptional regulator
VAGRIREQNRALILQAAERLFADKGFEGTTIQAIADLAGLPKSNVHYYFPTKERLYRTILEEILQTWLAAFGRFGEHDDPAEALASYVIAKVRLSFARPHASRIFAREMLNGGHLISPFLEDELRPWVEERAAVLRAWTRQGRLRPVDPHHLLFTIWAATQTYADFAPQIRAIEGGDPDAASQAAIARSVAEIVVRACVAQDDPGASTSRRGQAASAA